MIQTKLFSDRQNRTFRVLKFYKNEKILVSLQTAGSWFHARILQRAISKANERERLHGSLAFLGGPRGRWWRNHRPRGASLREGVRHRYLNPHEVGSGEEKVHVCKFRQVAARLLYLHDRTFENDVLIASIYLEIILFSISLFGNSLVNSLVNTSCSCFIKLTCFINTVIEFAKLFPITSNAVTFFPCKNSYEYNGIHLMINL